MNQTRKTFSIIILSGAAHASQIAHRAIEAMRENDWEGQFLHVDTAFESLKDEQEVGNEQFISCRNFSLALRKSKHDTIVVLDDQALVDADQWRWAEKRLDQEPLQCLYRPSDPPTRKTTKALFWIYSIIARLILKQPTNALTPAVLMIDNQRSTIDALVESCHLLKGRDQVIWKIISLVRFDDAAQTRVNLAMDSYPTKKIHGRSIFAEISKFGKFWFSAVMFPAPGTTYQSSRSKGWSKKLQRCGAWCVLLLTAIVMLGSQLSYPLFEPDETRNAQLALNIIEHDQWMTLQLQGQHYWDKPPLMAWLTAISYKTFGISAATSRLPGVLLIIACVALVCFIGKRIVGFRAAWIGAMLTLLSCGIPFSGRYLTMDGALTLFATAMILSVYVGSFESRFRKSWWIAAGIFTGLGLLAKGPIMIVICVPPVMLFAWLTGKPIFNRARRGLYWLVPCLLVAGPWFIGTIIATPEFLAYFFWKHHVVRFSAAFNHQQPIWYYIPVVLIAMFPASQLLLAGYRFIATRKPKVRKMRSKAHGYLVVVALWLFVFFSFSQAKLPTYIFPAIPTLCLLLGAILDLNIFSKIDTLEPDHKNSSWLNSRQQPVSAFYRRLPIWLGINMAAWIALISLIMINVLPSAAASKPFMMWSGALTIVLLFIACHRRAHPVASWTANCILALFLSTLVTNRIVPAVSQTRSIQQSVAQMKAQTQFADKQIVYFARDNFAPELLLRGESITHFPESETHRAAQYLAQQPNTILVSTPEHIKTLRKSLDWRLRISKYQPARHVYLISPVDQPSARLGKNETDVNSSIR